MHDLSLIYRLHSSKRLAPFSSTKRKRRPIRPLVIHYVIYPSGRIKTTIEIYSLKLLSNKSLCMIFCILILIIILYHMFNFFDSID